MNHTNLVGVARLPNNNLFTDNAERRWQRRLIILQKEQRKNGELY